MKTSDRAFRGTGNTLDTPTGSTPDDAHRAALAVADRAARDDWDTTDVALVLDVLGLLGLLGLAHRPPPVEVPPQDRCAAEYGVRESS